MRSNKLFDLITALSKTEIHQLSQQFKLNHEHKSKYVELFELLINRDISSLSKEEIFTKLYDNPYTEEKDYLLRNVYRNLTRKIEDFLIEESFHETINNNLNIHNYFLLKSFDHLKLYHLIEKDYTESVNHALADGDYLMASSITSLQINNYMHHLTPKVRNFESADNLLSLQMAYLGAFYLNHQYKNEIKKKQISNLINTDSKSNEAYNYLNENDQLYEVYLTYKYELFSKNIDDNIAHLKKCISLLNELPETFKNIEEEKQFCNISLAHEYVLTDQYDKANTIYEELLKVEDSIEASLKATLIFNYISNLIRQENYDTALEKIHYYESDIAHVSDSLQLKLKFLKLMLYAFLKDEALLCEFIPTCNSLIDYEKYICRFLYSIVSYLRNDYEDAYRECLNMKNSLRYKGPKFDVRDILGFYLRFYNLHKNNIDNSNNLYKGLKRLQKDMHTYHNNALPEFKEYLPFLWLEKEVRHVLDVQH
ncbi:hypothetical protein [Tenacibaculum amylolyticum]|uniref:hypothetical protein n=1 Tax=Tenacibaculum amylolyticum TaxID=104269 RepID=UPI003894E4EE